MFRLTILERLGLYRPLDYDHKRFDRLAHRCNEIEAIFFSAAYFELSKWGVLTPQLKASGYRLDFGLEGEGFNLAIEIDGHDYQRERNLKRRGWRFIRFTGSDIFGDVQQCVREVVNIVRTY